MGINFVRLAILEIDSAAVGLVAGNPGTEMFIYVSDPLVIGFAVFICFRVRIGVAAAPERLDETLTLFVGLQLIPCLSFGLGNDRADVFKPLLERVVRLLFNLALFVLRINATAPVLRRHGWHYCQ